nr:DNA polymerase III subunit delta [Aliikangiella sp. G2MR2-5]
MSTINSRNICPVNIVISEDPLLLQEACDRLIAQAKSIGVEQREIVDVVDKYNWTDLLASSSSMGLFSEIKLTDIRFIKVPNKEAQGALVELAMSANQESLLLVRLPKLDKRQKSTKWFKALSKDARVQELWPPKPYEFPEWVRQRAAQLQVKLSPAASQMLAEQTEGNLLAAKQMLEKLQLLYGEQPVETEQLAEMVSDNAKYSVFLCLDEALAGKGQRAVRMLRKFEQEGVVPISVLVNLTREIELCNLVAVATERGSSPMQALAKSFLWDSKKRLIVNAAQRLPLIIWQRLLVRCAYLDRMVKGQEKGDIWQELEQCLWILSGTKIWGQQASQGARAVGRNVR